MGKPGRKDERAESDQSEEGTLEGFAYRYPSVPWVEMAKRLGRTTVWIKSRSCAKLRGLKAIHLGVEVGGETGNTGKKRSTSFAA